MNNNDLAQNVHRKLLLLKDVISDHIDPDGFVDLHHSIVDELETLGPDLSRFRMPDSGSGASPLTSENLCVSAFLQEKIEGLLGLFRISAENGRKEIEFISP